jgi:uncharacterized protein (DUF433 family)
MGELVAFFSDEQAARLARITVRQLRYWRGTAEGPPVFLPDYPADADEGSVNTFRDVVALRTLGMLRRRVPLQELRKIGEWLHGKYQSPWSSLRFYVSGKEVFLEEPGTGERFAVRPEGQKLMKYELEQIASDLTNEVRLMFERPPELRGHVDKRGLIAGTRIAASTIWSFMSEGYDTARILAEYPSLSAEDVDAAVRYETERRAKTPMAM